MEQKELPPCWIALPGLTGERLVALSPPISSSPTHPPVLKSSDQESTKLTGSLEAPRQLSVHQNNLVLLSQTQRPLTKQVGPDVAGLRVDAEDALEASPEGGHGWSVAVQQVVIVLQPVREHIVRDDPPASLPDLE